MIANVRPTEKDVFLHADEKKIMPTLTPVLKKESLTDMVADYLRQGIMQGRFRPGDRLVEREICELLDVSRSSVREAMCILEADKLIDRKHRRGPVVATINYEDAYELYAYRTLLEGFAVYEFTKLADDSELIRFKDAMFKLSMATNAEDIKQILTVATEIYDIIFTGCRNSLVKESLIKLLDRINLLRITSLTRPNRIAISFQEMEEMAKFIFARDADAAKQSAIVHIQEAAKAALIFLENTKK